MTSLVVRAGNGGIKPLTDRDRREIAVHRAQDAGGRPVPRGDVRATRFEPGSGRRRHASAARSPWPAGPRPLRLQVTETGDGRYHATGTVVQSDFGIKPYTGFFGALKVSDPVQVEADVDLSGRTAR